MPLSDQAQEFIAQLDTEAPKMGDIKKLAKTIKKDHELAWELWKTGKYLPRLLAALIFDPKQLTGEDFQLFAQDMPVHDAKQRHQMGDWLLAHQLMKSKDLTAIMQTWMENPLPILRRFFWYHQLRLRWTGKTPPPENSGELMNAIEAKLAGEDPDVQWAMNLCAGWIGVFEPQFRDRCIQLGASLELYKEEKVPKNCTPNYLPEFIRIEVGKRS